MWHCVISGGVIACQSARKCFKYYNLWYAVRFAWCYWEKISKFNIFHFLPASAVSVSDNFSSPHGDSRWGREKWLEVTVILAKFHLIWGLCIVRSLDKPQQGWPGSTFSRWRPNLHHMSGAPIKSIHCSDNWLSVLKLIVSWHIYWVNALKTVLLVFIFWTKRNELRNCRLIHLQNGGHFWWLEILRRLEKSSRGHINEPRPEKLCRLKISVPSPTWWSDDVENA